MRGARDGYVVIKVRNQEILQMLVVPELMSIVRYTYILIDSLYKESHLHTHTQI